MSKAFEMQEGRTSLFIEYLTDGVACLVASAFGGGILYGLGSLLGSFFSPLLFGGELMVIVGFAAFLICLAMGVINVAINRNVRELWGGE